MKRRIWLDYVKWFCTKMANDVRFTIGFNEDRLTLRRQVNDVIGHICGVYYLREADGARAECASVGQNQYEPTLDVDRYVVKCTRFHGDIDRCAVFERVTMSVKAQCLHSLGLKKDGVDAHDPALIRGGDGHFGMISDMANSECSFLPSEGELAEICKGCKHRCDDAAQSRCCRQDEFNRSHAGIIPFLKRLFGGTRHV